jgi:hypothetical protein
LSGLSLSDYLLKEIRTVAEQPSLDELRRRLHERAPVALKESTAAAVRAERDSR